MHTYRATSTAGDRAWTAVLAGVCLIPAAGSVADAVQHGPSWAAAPSRAFGFAVSAAGVCLVYRRYARRCTEIRLGDDGTCEFVAPRRSVRLHVHQIESVRCRVDDETGREEKYTIRYRGGRIVASGTIADFHGFVGRLRAVNPGVDLTRFPTESAPARRSDSETERRVEQLLRDLFFLAIVIILLVWLVIQTLSAG